MIGLEVHAQLRTDSKLFCGCSTDYHDAEPNTHTCEVCLGMPGALPVMNESALDFGLRVSLALGCEVVEEQLFYRKNYFYPDLPKNFQITQYEFPVGVDGSITIQAGDGERAVGVRRVHLEEDPGRIVHMRNRSLLDYNRSGVPLLEIVTEPDMESPEEGREFLQRLRTTLEYLGVFEPLDGAMRADANVSIEGGSRVEVKNISSHRGAERALRYEITRQRNMLKRGSEAVLETRHFDEETGVTRPMRTKEEEADYRYFPEPNLPLIRVDEGMAGAAAEGIPELPDQRRERFREEYGVTDEHAKRLTAEKKLADFYEDVAEAVEPRAAASHVVDELLGELNYRELSLDEWFEGVGRETAVEWETEIVEMLRGGEITDVSATDVLRDVLDESRSPTAVVDEKGLTMEGADEALKYVEEVIGEHREAVEDYLSGKEEALNFLVGQVVRRSRGKISPREASDLFDERLEEEK